MVAPNTLKFGVAMLTQEQKTILGKLGYYSSFLAVALPSRSIPTFCELLVANSDCKSEIFQFPDIKNIPEPESSMPKAA